MTVAFPPTATGVVPPPQPAARQPSRDISADFETFLTMLTTQMRNQDPLNPMESTDFAVQLATFSGVEQQVQTNQLLQAMAAGSALGEMAGMVGMEARVPGPVPFDGTPVTLAIGPVPGATSHELVAYGPMGTEVGRQPVDPTQGDPVWSGLGPDGQPLPPGLYRFEVVGLADGAPVGALQAETFARISEVQRGATDAVFVLADGRRVSAGDIGALREAAAPTV